MSDAITLPEELLYTPEGLWIRIVDSTTTVGFTPYYAIDDTPDYIDLPEIGVVARGADIGTYVGEWLAFIIKSPLDGEIIEVNELLEDDPELIIKSPFENGWLMKLALSDNAAAFNARQQLISADALMVHLQDRD